MKLYLSELKKLYASHLTVVLLIGLLVLNAVLAGLASRPSQVDAAVREAYAQYHADPAAMDAYYADLERMAVENRRDDAFSLPHTFCEEGDDLLVLRLMYERVDYVAGHEKQMARLVKAAENRILDLQYYGYDEDSYEIRTQRQLIEHYASLCGRVSPTDAYAHGYDDYLVYPMTAILAGLFITVSVAYIYLNDRACGFCSILRTTHGGRTRTALGKLGATMTVAVTATVLLSLSAFAAVGVTAGYSDPTAAVQTLPLCATVPFSLTVGEYLLLRLVLCILAMLTYAGFVAVAASLGFSYVGCLGIGALFWGVNYGFFSREYLGTPPAVRYLNFASLAEGNRLTDFYRSVSVLDRPVSHPTALCVWAVLLAAALSVLAVLFSVKDFRGLSVLRRRLPWRLPTWKSTTERGVARGHRVRLSLVGYELRKIRFAWLLAAILLLLGAKGVYTYRAAGNMERYDEALYYDYITTIQPMDTSARGDYMMAERARLDAVMADYLTRTDAFERGELSHEDYAAYLDTYYAAKARDGVFRRVENYVMAIEAHDRLTGRESDILYTTGYEVFFGFSSDLFFYFAGLALTVGVFAVEYRRTSSVGSSVPLIRATPRGRRRTFATKLGICTVSGCLLAVLFRAAGLCIVAQGYVLPAMGATVSSIPGFGSVLSDMTVGQYLLLDFCMQALVGALMGALMGALSCLCRRPLPILSTVLLLTAIPELLSDTLFPGAHPFSLLSLTTPQKLFWQSVEKQLLSLPGAWMAFVCLALTALVAVVVFVAHRIYNGRTRVRKGAAS